MQGKICLITGANTGIGKATAISLARQGARVIMVCRNDARGRSAMEEVKAKSGSSTVDLLTADLSSQSAIRDLASRFLLGSDRLDVLINNAGLWKRKREVTVDGFEMHFAVNHLAYFLLTNLLLDALKAAAAARIVSVASGLHERGEIDFDALQAERSFGGVKAYSNSKLANVLFTYELARRLNGSGVTANCLHPGVVATDLVRETFPAPMRWLGGFILTSPEKGAATSIYLATSPEVAGVSGKYFAKQRERRSSRESYDAALASRLWDVSSELTSLAPDQ